MIIKGSIGTEKWIGKIEFENTIAFFVDKKATKKQIKDEIMRLFNAKADEIRTHIRGNRKIAVVKLGKDAKAEDIATKLKMV
ncbi:50S ribosomal protein L23 [Candidatus Micrarchaeota archaeon]|nr:50S ribosomal protein L23 [Candidatus Micrarchaeota archaeon]